MSRRTEWLLLALAAASMRVTAEQWPTVLYTLFYVSAIAAACYLLALMLLRRKNFM